MTKQHFPIHYALLLASMAWLPMQARTIHSFMNEPPEETEDKVIIEHYFPVLENETSDTIFLFAEKMPEFPGGPIAMKKYLQQHFQYPPEALELRLDGKVIVEFTILKNGKIQDIEVVQSIYPAVDNEAVKVVSSMPAWIPGEHYGKKVNVRYRYIVHMDARFNTYYQTCTTSPYPAADGLLLAPSRNSRNIQEGLTPC